MSKLRGLSLFVNVGIAEAFLVEIGVDIKIANEFLKNISRRVPINDTSSNTNYLVLKN